MDLHDKKLMQRLFQGPFSFDSRKQLITAHLWMHFSYDYCACLLAGFFLWDAIRNSNSEDVTVDLQVSSFAAIHKMNAPPVAAIQLSQTVEVVEEHPLQDKKSLYQVYSR